VPVITTGNVALNSAIITGIPTTAGLTAGNWAVIGNFLPTAAPARRASVGRQHQSGHDDHEASGTATATPITFAQDTYSIQATSRPILIGLGGSDQSLGASWPG